MHQNNYRAISKNTILSKIIDYILLDKVGDKLTTSIYQFAYKEGYSTSLCSFLVAETIQYYKTNGSNVFMLSLDATKAFDLVQYSKLFKLLIDKNIQGVSKVPSPWFFSICKKTINARKGPLPAKYWY